jgi:hypothetical protein
VRVEARLPGQGVSAVGFIVMTGRDPQILGRIQGLVEEERALRGGHVGKALDDQERSRLTEIEVELDQCWDLLNQRRALREFGMDPNQASDRDDQVVEGYQQ